MPEPAGVVEILVQILQNTPILKYSFRIPPPPKMKIVRDLGTLTFLVSESGRLWLILIFESLDSVHE